MQEKVRLDKWLWAVRLYKTRSIAAEACEKGRIRSGENILKPGKSIRAGEILLIHRGAWTQTIKVLGLSEKRMGAAFVKDLMEDLTSPEELEKFKNYLAARNSFNLKHGPGRPTKKDRRAIDDYMEEW